MKNGILIALGVVGFVALAFGFATQPQGAVARGVGYLFVVLAAYSLVMGVFRILWWRRAIGRIVEHVPGQMYNKGRQQQWNYKVAFLADGREAEAVVHGGMSGSDPVAVGRELPIFYPPHRPEKAEIFSKMALFVLPMVLGGMGWIFLAAF